MRPIVILAAGDVRPGDRVLVGHKSPFLADVHHTRRRYDGDVTTPDTVKITVKNVDLLMTDDFDVTVTEQLIVQRGTSGLDR